MSAASEWSSWRKVLKTLECCWREEGYSSSSSSLTGSILNI